ncbi:hypothetical protein ACIBJF_48105, partial [Streptomyces sp. NPDC050743]|uniref:hypothetical protein n=1 Tax=Streptomyces sp. NPDC050743 TaxID=3365634 RepID=UPI0037A8AF1A
GPGRLEPGRCRGRKTTRAAGSGGGLSRRSPLNPGGRRIPLPSGRGAFNRFDEFERSLGIAPNMLTAA